MAISQSTSQKITDWFQDQPIDALQNDAVPNSQVGGMGMLSDAGSPNSGSISTAPPETLGQVIDTGTGGTGGTATGANAGGSTPPPAPQTGMLATGETANDPPISNTPTGNPYPGYNPLAPGGNNVVTPPVTGTTYGGYNEYNLGTNPAATTPAAATPPPATPPTTLTQPTAPTTPTAPTSTTTNTVNGSTTTTTAPTNQQGILQSNGSTTINPNALTTRVIDPATETVEGRLTGMLSGNNPYIQTFRDNAMRDANMRGLSNSSIAASAGEEAAAKAGIDVATPDAAAYQKASDYNTALKNQALMYNVDTQNQFQLQSNTIEGQKAIAQISAASAANVAGINAAAQLSAATLSAENQRFIAQMNSETSRYNSDQSYRAQQDQNRTTLTNNIINNMDLSPDRKFELLNALGQGALATAIYVPDPTIVYDPNTSNGGFKEGDTRTFGGQKQRWSNGKWEVAE